MPAFDTVRRLASAADFDIQVTLVDRRLAGNQTLTGVVRGLIERGEFDHEPYVLRWLLNEFARNVWNELSQAQREVALCDEPPRCGHRSWDAFFAGLAEYLAEQSGLSTPLWCSDDWRTLPEWWYPLQSDSESYRNLVSEDPAPSFVVRQIGLTASSLSPVLCV